MEENVLSDLLEELQNLYIKYKLLKINNMTLGPLKHFFLNFSSKLPLLAKINQTMIEILIFSYNMVMYLRSRSNVLFYHIFYIRLPKRKNQCILSSRVPKMPRLMKTLRSIFFTITLLLYFVCILIIV